MYSEIDEFTTYPYVILPVLLERTSSACNTDNGCCCGCCSEVEGIVVIVVDC